MSSLVAQQPPWVRKLRLEERLALIKANLAAVDTDDGLARLSCWRASTLGAAVRESLGKYLGSLGVDERDFVAALGTRPNADGTPTDRWSATPSLPMALAHGSEPDVAAEADFLRPWHEALSAARAHIVNRFVGVQGMHDRVDIASIERMLERDQAALCVPLVARTLVLELNVARVSGLLRGTTGEERYADFVGRLADGPTVAALKGEYAVLDRSISECIGRWSTGTEEWLSRLAADWPVIVDTFPELAAAGPVVNCRAAGDLHRGGRAVRILTFRDGQRLVYKPRSLAVDLAFEQLLQWLSRAGMKLALRHPRTLDRGSHGWCEFIASAECRDAAALSRFYQRTGALLCLLYVCEGADCHYENLVAAGEWPVLIDLEGVFCPRVALPDHPGDRALSESVLRVGMLPGFSIPARNGVSLDFSAIAAGDGPVPEMPVQHWNRGGTDEMHLSTRLERLERPASRPTLDGGRVAPALYWTDIIGGFEDVYDVLVREREMLCVDGGPLSQFADVEVRHFPRATQRYIDIINALRHPDAMRDGMEAERTVMGLWVGGPAQDHLQPLRAYERSDVLAGDVPLFTSRPSCRDVYASDGGRVSDYFMAPSLDRVRANLRRLSPQDRRRQEWIIQASRAGLGKSLRTPDTSLEAPLVATRSDLLNAIRHVSRRLLELNVGDESDPTWLTIKQTDTRSVVAPVGVDLYDGMWGVALFLTFLARLDGDTKLALLSERAITPTLRRIAAGDEVVAGIGGFDGWAGILYSLTLLRGAGARCVTDDLFGVVLDRIRSGIDSDDRFDVISGAAGAIGAALAYEQHCGDLRARKVAVAAAEHLLRCGATCGDTMTWQHSSFAQPLSGFGHGQAGIAWALARLGRAEGAVRYVDGASAALRYERATFSSDAQNWPDLRNRDGVGFMAAWCHGAVGIGLSRLDLCGLLPDEGYCGDLEAAVRVGARWHFNGDHSLCHGTLGAIELLAGAREIIHWPGLARAIETHTGRVVADIARGRFGCSTAEMVDVDAPGLMTGLAGVGIGLLRLVERARTPAILQLQPFV